ncbi:peptide chain release factor N(5)-glutamine methyltransferase [Neolewinella antarctica]|uniref:peptide chain release factor N(5)-glutamine methyltransferase n=1 Tax=Neolewinella antarctica TaxID=442734 RepID=A0ABX0X9L8_9BACT|nr:peptide chain release factor N(5)-glutamine methyltransferase [Neolewinella antarctica]NJC25931.1 release factor glutamine methyltransferase [Neolewinella antarctica]
MRTSDLAQHLITELSPTLGVGEANSVSRLVLEDLFGWRRGHRPRLLTQDEEVLAWTTVNRLVAGEPVQYITGIADFYGLQFKVTPDVLIPRPETEELVEWILADNPRDVPFALWDLGSGSGCIPLAIASKREFWTCAGSDVSEGALAVARENAGLLKLDVAFSQFDILRPGSPAQPTYDIICSNPPYIPPSEKANMSPSTIDHEPGLALFVPENDPLIFYRALAGIGWKRLRPGGQLYVETNEFNNAEVAALFEKQGYAVERRKDLQGKWRMVRGTRPATQ